MASDKKVNAFELLSAAEADVDMMKAVAEALKGEPFPQAFQSALAANGLALKELGVVKSPTEARVVMAAIILSPHGRVGQLLPKLMLEFLAYEHPGAIEALQAMARSRVPDAN